MPNIIGDIAGQYDALMSLLKQMPDDEPVSVGDMCDRGPKSKEVFEFFMKNGKAIFGNHEHLMLDELRRNGFYPPGCWMYNGGRKTLHSFDPHEMHNMHDVIPEDILRWVERLPLYMKFGDVFVSHSFIPQGQDLKRACQIDCWGGRGDPRNIIWCRDVPVRRNEYSMQIAGHNSQFGFRRFSDNKGDYAICLDSSRDKKLTGIHIPSMEIFQQPF